MGITINSRILLAVASIAAAGALVVGATFAFFSDSATSTNNVFAAGNLNLQLDDNDETSPAESVSASFGGTNMAPGATPSAGFISLHNAGSIAASSVKMGVDETANDGDGNDLTQVVDVTVKKGDDNACETNSSDLTGTIATAVGDTFSPLTLSELKATDYSGLPGIAPGGTYYLCFTAQMESGAGDQYQSNSATESFIFTANQ